MRARRRLIGAAVLLGIGIIGFPLVFETQPRPIAVDIPIDVPRKDGAPPLTMPAARAPEPEASVQAAQPVAVAPAPQAGVITESQADAGREVPASTPLITAAKPVAEPKAVAEIGPSVTNADGARAKALLEGASTERTASVGRFVVQVGAFAEASAARETRLKVERLGMKTYTQIASTAAGDRIRVRVGPFGTRDEADRALAKARSAGLTAVVLTL